MDYCEASEMVAQRLEAKIAEVRHKVVAPSLRRTIAADIVTLAKDYANLLKIVASICEAGKGELPEEQPAPEAAAKSEEKS